MNELGVETLDADGIVHALIPAEERRRLAAEVFANPERRRELEARIHPVVRSRIDEWLAAPSAGRLRVAVIPLLFEVHWDSDYDIIICIASAREKQLERMMETRGYSRKEAEGRLAAQMDVSDKAGKSHYAIWNDGSPEQLKNEAARLVAWLQKQVNKT